METSSKGRHDVPNFKPVSLRWPLLIPFVLYICGLIAALECSTRVFPSAADRGDIPQVTGGRQSIPLVSIPLSLARQPFPTPDLTSLAHGAQRKRSTTRTTRRVVHKPRDFDEPIFDNSTESSGDNEEPKGPISKEDIQRRFIEWAQKNHEPAVFAEQDAFAPAPFYNQSIPLLNETAINGSATRPPARFRPRHQDPAKYAELSGKAQIVVPWLWVTYSDDMVPIAGTSVVFYVNEEETDESLCWALCDGPAVVFRELHCWEHWVRASLFEDEARAANTSAVWTVIEEMQYGAQSCQVAGQLSPDPQEANDPDVAPAKTEVEVVTDLSGRPTFTVSRLISTLAPRATAVTLRDSTGSPTATVTVGPTPRPEKAIVLTNSNGVPAQTVTWSPTLTTMTLRDSAGSATATVTAEISPGEALLTLTDSNGVPTTTITASQPWATKFIAPPPTAEDGLHPLTHTSYSIAYFLPVFLCSPISILAQVISSDIKALLPFHLLLRPGGVRASHSLLLSTGGINGVVNSFRLLFEMREPISFLCDLLVLLAAVITALSSEAVGINLYGSCLENNFRGCYMGIAVFATASRALQGLLCVILVVVVVITCLLFRWRTGVNSNTHSMVATASLTQDVETRKIVQRIKTDWEDDIVLRQSELTQLFGTRRFILGHFYNSARGSEDYGVHLQSDPSAVGTSNTDLTLIFDRNGRRKPPRRRPPPWLTHQPTTDWNTLCAISLFSGLLALILYYETTQLDTPFEDFMNDQNFGARVLFTALGVGMTLFWGEYLSSVSRVEPYRHLALHPQPAQTSVLVSPPTTVFTGLAGAILRREWFITSVGFATILSEFLPILLSLIPFSPSQTWITHQVCAWATVGCLSFMILVLVGGACFVRSPHMLVDPACLAGRMYYVCDSAMLEDCQGLTMVSPDERARQVSGERRYWFGRLYGVSGERRVGVDYDTRDDESDVEGWKASSIESWKDDRKSLDMDGGGGKDDTLAGKEKGEVKM